MSDDQQIRVRNFTPHNPITFLNGGVVVLPQEGLARCEVRERRSGSWDCRGDLPITYVGYGGVTGLPAPEKGTILLVSQLVVRALPDRTDLAFPHNLVRDAEGTITGFTTLARLEEGS